MANTRMKKRTKRSTVASRPSEGLSQTRSPLTPPRETKRAKKAKKTLNDLTDDDSESSYSFEPPISPPPIAKTSLDHKKMPAKKQPRKVHGSKGPTSLRHVVNRSSSSPIHRERTANICRPKSVARVNRAIERIPFTNGRPIQRFLTMGATRLYNSSILGTDDIKLRAWEQFLTQAMDIVKNAEELDEKARKRAKSTILSLQTKEKAK